MTASWNSTGEGGWPEGRDGREPQPFEPSASDSEWPSFADSLRAHGFEVAPPPTAQPDAAIATNPAVPEQQGHAQGTNAEPAPSHAEPAAAQASTDAAPYASTAPGHDEPEPEPEDDFDAPVLPDIGFATERLVSVFGAQPAYAVTGAVFEGRIADEEWPEATADHSSGNGQEPLWTDSEPAATGDQEAVADTASDHGATTDVTGASQPDDWTTEHEHAPQAAGWNPPQGANAPQTLPDNRLPTPPPELAALLARRGAAAAPQVMAPEPEPAAVEPVATVADEPVAEAPIAAFPEEPPAEQQAEALAPEPLAEEQPDAQAGMSAGAPGFAFVHDSTEDAATDANEHVPQAAEPEFVPWTYEASAPEEVPAVPAVPEAAAAPDAADAPAAAAAPAAPAVAQPATEGLQQAEQHEEPQQDAASDFWSTPAEDHEWSAGVADDQPSDGAAALAAVPDDPWAVAVDQDQGWNAGVAGSAAVLAADAVPDAAPREAPDWSGWSPAEPSATDQESAAAGDHPTVADGGDAPTRATGDGTGEQSPAPDTAASKEVAVDWYEAAAIDAVGTNAGDALSNTEFVGYDEQAAAEAARVAAASTDDHAPADHVIVRETEGHPGLAAAALVAGTYPNDEWPEARRDDHWSHDEATPAATADAWHEGPSREPASTTAAEAASLPAEPATSPRAESTPTQATPPPTGINEPDWPKPELADWSAADHDPWVSPTSVSGRERDSLSHSGLAVAAATAIRDEPVAVGSSASPSTAASGLFSRYDTPSMAGAAAGAATASPRGESDLWHLVSEPAASAPASGDRRSFDPVTVFLTVLVAIIIVALLLGLLYTVAPLLAGIAH